MASGLSLRGNLLSVPVSARNIYTDSPLGKVNVVDGQVKLDLSQAIACGIKLDYLEGKDLAAEVGAGISAVNAPLALNAINKKDEGLATALATTLAILAEGIFLVGPHVWDSIEGSPDISMSDQESGGSHVLVQLGDQARERVRSSLIRDTVMGEVGKIEVDEEAFDVQLFPWTGTSEYVEAKRELSDPSRKRYVRRVSGWGSQDELNFLSNAHNDLVVLNHFETRLGTDPYWFLNREQAEAVVSTYGGWLRAMKAKWILFEDRSSYGGVKEYFYLGVEEPGSVLITPPHDTGTVATYYARARELDDNMRSTESGYVATVDINGSPREIVLRLSEELREIALATKDDGDSDASVEDKIIRAINSHLTTRGETRLRYLSPNEAQAVLKTKYADYLRRLGFVAIQCLQDGKFALCRIDDSSVILEGEAEMPLPFTPTFVRNIL